MNFLFILEATTGDRLTEGFVALIAGMGTVFTILILISVIISLFKHIKNGEITHEHKETRINATVETKAVVEEVSVQDDLELIAVIMAAIAASLETTTDKLQVKSFRRISNKNGLSR